MEHETDVLHIEPLVAHFQSSSTFYIHNTQTNYKTHYLKLYCAIIKKTIKTSVWNSAFKKQPQKAENLGKIKMILKSMDTLIKII